MKHGAFALCLAISSVMVATVNVRSATVITGDVTPSLPWISSTDAKIGNTGLGTLTVSAGSVAHSDDVFLGYAVGASGSALVAGVGSQWNNSGNLYVGYEGTGDLTVLNGGSVSTPTLYASVDDLHGNGVIEATEGAVVDGALRFDASHGSTTRLAFGTEGVLTIHGTSTRALGAGYKGFGTLVVADGIAIGGMDGYLGYKPGSTGQALVSGTDSRWAVNSTFSVGHAGTGTLQVEAGGFVRSWYGAIGWHADSTGEASITSESVWDTRYLWVGRDGSGSLTITDGGLVTANTIYGSVEDLYGDGLIAAKAAILDDTELRFDGTYGTEAIVGFGSQGKMTVVGNGISLGAGYKGEGSMTVVAGMNVSSATGILGLYAGSTGIAKVSGNGSQWSTSDFLQIGRFGNGSLRVESGARINSRDAYIGSNGAESMGSVVITDAGSLWNNSNDLSVGRDGSGILNITKSGLVTVQGSLFIDPYAPIGDSYVNMSAGAMLAVHGDGGNSLAQFLGLVEGTDAIRYWDETTGSLALLISATYGEDYTLEYLTTGDLAGYTLLTVLAPGPPGDFEGDFDVDGADFLAWQRGESPDDANAADLDDWQAGYGLISAGSAAAVVPEPAAWLLIGISTITMATRRRWRRK